MDNYARTVFLRPFSNIFLNPNFAFISAECPCVAIRLSQMSFPIIA